MLTNNIKLDEAGKSLRQARQLIISKLINVSLRKIYYLLLVKCPD